MSSQIQKKDLRPHQMEENSKYYIEKFDLADFDKLIVLKNHCFNWTVSDEYFSWKFRDNPAGPLVAFVAKEYGTDRIISYYNMLPEMYMIDGRETKIYQCCEAMTHADYRRQGLFNKLAIRTLQYLKDTDNFFVFGIGGPTSSPGLLQIGMKEMFKICNFFKLKPLVKLSAMFGGSSEYTLKEVTDLNELLPIFNANQNVRPITKIKDLAFVKWRISNPRYQYKVLGCFKGTEVLGCAVYYKNDSNDYILFDLIVPSDSAKVKAQLIKGVERIIASTDFRALIGFTHKESQMGTALKKASFIVNPFDKGPLSFKNPFLMHTDEATFNRVNNPKLWNITSMDYDAM
jgi:hypothetical protein